MILVFHVALISWMLLGYRKAFKHTLPPPFKMSEEYESGQEAFYHEDGDIYKVQVMENKSDPKWEKYRLKVLEVVQKNPITPKIEAGLEFECDKLRNVACGGLWYLLDY